METQPKLLDVPVSAAQAQAESYAVLSAFVRLKIEELKAQAEIVIAKMDAAGQRKLSFRDEWGIRHNFEVADVGERLKYSHTRPEDKS